MIDLLGLKLLRMAGKYFDGIMRGIWPKAPNNWSFAPALFDRAAE